MFTACRYQNGAQFSQDEAANSLVLSAKKQARVSVGPPRPLDIFKQSTSAYWSADCHLDSSVPGVLMQVRKASEWRLQSLVAKLAMKRTQTVDELANWPLMWHITHKHFRPVSHPLHTKDAVIPSSTLLFVF